MNTQQPSLWDHRCVYTLSWQRFEDGSQQIFQDLQQSGYHPDVLICIVRGGLVLGTKLAHMLDISHFAVLHIQRNTTSEIYPERHPPLLTTPSLTIPEQARILIVDDIVGSGATMEAAVAVARAHHPSAIQTVSLAINSNGLKQRETLPPDHFAFHVSDWLIFPWENQDVARAHHLSVKEL